MHIKLNKMQFYAMQRANHYLYLKLFLILPKMHKDVNHLSTFLYKKIKFFELIHTQRA